MVLGFLCLILLLLLLVHTPPFQKWITTKASNYLSATTKAEVSVEEISFSLWGEIAVNGLEVNDPVGHSLLSAHKIAVRPNIISLLSGNLAFRYVEVVGLTCQLINTMDGFDLALELGLFNASDFELSTSPNFIKLSKIYLEKADVRVLSHQKPKDNEPLKLPPLDFGSGFDFEVDIIELKDNNIAFHLDEIFKTHHFDPNHLELSNVQLKLTDLFIRDDSLSVAVQQFTTELTDFSLSEFNGKFKANLNGLVLSDLFMSTADSEVRLDVTASYGDWFELLNDLDKANLELAIMASINPIDLQYFLQDTLLSVVEHWPPIALDINGRFSSGIVEIDTVSILAGNSVLLANGEVNKLQDSASWSWENVNINTTVGQAFKSLLTPYIGNYQLPQALKLQLTSSGNPSSFNLNSQIISSRGNIHTQGKVSLKQNTVAIDLMIDGDQVDVGGILDFPWLGPVNLAFHAVGDISNETGMAITGKIEKMSISDNQIKNIDIQSHFDKNGATITVLVKDPGYQSKIQSNILFREPYTINSNLRFDEFSLGKLLDGDTSLLVSGDINSIISIDQSTMSGFLIGQDLSLKTPTTNYLMDSLALDLMISPTASTINLNSDDINGVLEANFDIRKVSEVVDNLYKNYWGLSDSIQYPQNNRKFNFNVDVVEAAPLQLFIDDINDLSGLHISGNFHEKDQTLDIEAESHRFNGFGISLDTLQASFSALPHSINSKLLVENIFYDSVYVGNLDFHIFDEGDSIFSRLSLSRDTISVISITSHIQPANKGMHIYLDSLSSFNQEYTIDRNNSIFFEEGNILFNHFRISRNEFEITLNGDLNNFNLDIRGADLTKLNNMIGTDTTIINSGNLYGSISYNKPDHQFNFQAAVDSLVIYNSAPIKMEASAFTEKSSAPIHFSLQGVENNVEFDGEYFLDNSEIDATLLLDINKLTMFEFLFPEIIEELSGKVKGQTRITGPLQKLAYQGSLRFLDVEVTTSKPRSIFRLRDEVIRLDHTGVSLDDFTIYDQRQNPLVLNGTLRIKDLQSFEYDLTVDTDNYLLLNNPATEEYPLQGMLVIGSNFKLQGNERDTYVDAKIIIKDTTELTFVTPQENLELLTSEGIIEFVDPGEATDSISISQTQSFYDSLIATLPNFELTSAITLEDQAVLRVIVDARSGDFIEVFGTADLELSFDRTGNIQLGGSYTITKGFYQLSFYDMVKKKFNIAGGSSVVWTGDPTNGELDIKAFQTILTSSTGLIGHEIGENEKSLYRKSLPYEVAIIITGTIKNPEISFTLDLPKDDKINYPSLANKLDRLEQPEYESELNKQVFGLLVLGGFIPESSDTEYDQSLIATTALTNSVSSILASQLNRFASQFIKGVDINIQMQSYSDYTSGGGQTRTAMDFKVTKRMMNDRLSIEVGGGVDVNFYQSGGNTGSNEFRHEITVLYDLTESGSKQLKMFNNETYDIIYHEVRNTGIALIFIREFDRDGKKSRK